MGQRGKTTTEMPFRGGLGELLVIGAYGRSPIVENQPVPLSSSSPYGTRNVLPVRGSRAFWPGANPRTSSMLASIRSAPGG